MGKKQAMYQWHVWTEDADIVTEYGLVDGEKQIARKAAAGKNIGKKNETSPGNQAIKEASSMHKNKLTRKYSTSIEEAQNPVFLPMLAKDFEKRKTKVKYPVWVQPKLDGVRCMAYWDGDEVKVMSRSGRPYDVPHLAKDISKFLPQDHVLDGEIYIHGLTFQQISKLVSKWREEPSEATGGLVSSDLELWAFDVFQVGSEAPWSSRRVDLEELICKPEDQDRKDNIVHVSSLLVNFEEEVYREHDLLVAAGFEGAILRTPDSTYRLGHRSNNLLKVKKFEDDEFKITGYYEGKGKFKGCVTWICETEDKQEFHCCPKGTLAMKKKWFEEGHLHVGKLLKVKYQGKTDDGSLRFPVGLGFRLPEDM
jgi:DNA ligase-1